MASRVDPKEALPPDAAVPEAAEKQTLSRKPMQRTSSTMGLPGQPARVTSSSSQAAEPPAPQVMEQDKPMRYMPKAYSEMVPMTRTSSFEGPGPVRANSDGIVPFLRMVPDSTVIEDDEVFFVPKCFSEVQMPASRLSFHQPAPSNSDGLLANREFMRAVDAARERAAQQRAEAERLPGGVKKQGQVCLATINKEKMYEGKIVKAFKLGLLLDINADVLGLLRWKHVRGVPRKLLKEGGHLANLRVDKVGDARLTLRLECIGHEGQTFEEEDYPDVVARVYEWAMEPKMLQLAEEAAPTAVKRHPGRNGPRAVGEGMPIRPPPPFSASRPAPATSQAPSAAAEAQRPGDKPMPLMPKAYSEAFFGARESYFAVSWQMVPMTRFEGPGPVRANSDGIVPFLRMVPDSTVIEDDEVFFVPKSFSEVQMPASRLSFQQPAPSNSDGLLANRAFMRAVDAAREHAAQQRAEEAARLPGGVKKQGQVCLATMNKEKMYEGKIVKAFKLGLLLDINADVLGLLRWKHVRGVPRKLLKEGGHLANLRVDKVGDARLTLRLECAEVARYCMSGSAGLFKHFVGSRAGMLAYRGIGHEGQTFEEEDYPDVVARVYEWAIEPKMLQLAEEAAPTVVKRHPGRNGPRAVGDGEGMPIRPPPPFSASRFLRPGKCGPRQ
ncbi:unnamed protein product [Symbiodinium sp. CCMP2592]|nr:unnamed protein product [Symbiodinium sp. CCMP2592]